MTSDNAVARPRPFDWTWKRNALFGALYAAFMLVFVTIGLWRYPDLVSYAVLSGLAQDREISTEVVPIDLGSGAGNAAHGIPLRAPILRLLQTVACGRPLSPGGGCRRGTLAGIASRPQAIVLDVEFTTDCRDPAVPVATLQRVLRTLIGQRIPIYGLETPLSDSFGTALTARDFPSCRNVGGMPLPDADIYDRGYVSATGHTWIEMLPAPLPQNVGWYRTWLPGPGGADLQALPLEVVRTSASQVPIESSEPIFFGLGPENAFSGSPGSALVTLGAVLADPRLIDEKVAIVGNIATDRRIAGRSAFELLAWAISDLKRASTAHRTEGWLGAAVTLVDSALAFFGYLAFFRWLRTMKYSYLLALAAALAGALLALAAFVATLFAAHQLYGQVALPIVGSIAAALLALRWTRDRVVHERFLQSLWAESSEVEAFDVFISYARDPENAQWVHDNVFVPLAAARRADGTPLRVFFDRESITLGMDWYERIVTAIHGSAYFVPIYSKGYFERWFCRDELELAMLRRNTRPRFILPVMRYHQSLPRPYRRINYTDVREAHFVDHLREAILKDDLRA